MKFKLLKWLAPLARTGLFCVFALLLSIPGSAAAVTVNLSPTNAGSGFIGPFSLSVSNLPPGATILVQKYLDLNSNGVVDPGDWLVQQVSITDGQGPPVIGGVTNMNVPGDLDLTPNGLITAQFYPGLGGPEQSLAAHYLYVISSPTGAFPAVTNAVVVTHTGYGQLFAGTVTDGETPVPFAIVWLATLPPTGDNSGGVNLFSGAVADASGNYFISAPVGTYQLIAAAANYVAQLALAPTSTLESETTNLEDLVVTSASGLAISGSLVDASNASVGLPGVLMAAIYYTNNYGPIGFGTTDSNGNYTLPVSATNDYNVNNEPLALNVLGYVALTTNANEVVLDESISDVTISPPRASALIYGVVTDTNSNPLPGVVLKGNNGTNNGMYGGQAKTDSNGRYVLGAVAGNWSVDVKDQNPPYNSYIFSSGPAWTYDSDGVGTNLTAGMAAQANFTAIPAPFEILGGIAPFQGDSFSGVEVTADATIGGAAYTLKTITDSDGNFTFTVPAGNWELTFDCDPLYSDGYECLDATSVSVVDTNVETSVGPPRPLPRPIQFTANPTNGPAPLTVTFTAPATDSYGDALTNWLWDFGDGGTSTNPSPSHTYSYMDISYPTLYVTDTNGNVISTSGPAINTDPLVSFAASPTEGPASLTVQFTIPSVDNYGFPVTNWSWDFGDDIGSSSDQNPTYTYNANGTYIPTLYVEDTQGYLDYTYGPTISVAPFSGLVLNGDFETGDLTGWTTTDDGDVNVISDTNETHSQPYSASFGAVGYQGFLSQTLATTPGVTYLLSFWLDEPDGATPNEFSVSWGGQVIMDQTNIPATGWTNFQFLLTATSTSTVLQFGGRDDPTYLYLDQVDVESNYVQFAASPTSGPAALTVLFTSPSVDSNTNTLTSWNWHFGDAASGITNQNPSHTYANSGTYTPTFTATYGVNGTVTGFGPTIVVGPATVQITATPTEGSPPLNVTFNVGTVDSYGYALTNWSWDFGDGIGTSTISSPTYTYNETGTYTPTLTALDAGGNQIVVSGPNISVAQFEGLVLNGGFETANFTGWTLSGDALNSYVYDSDDYSHSGRYFAFLQTSGLGYGSLSQSLSTSPGSDYILSFWLNGHAGGIPNEFTVFWDGNMLLDLTNVVTTGWTNIVIPVTAATTNSDLEFTFLDVSNSLGLDDVSVETTTNTTVTWPAPASITYGTPLSSVQLNASASVPGAFAYTPANGAVLNAGSHTLWTVFTPTDTNNYSVVTNTTTLEVDPAPLTVTASSAFRTYGQPNPALTGSLSGLVNGDPITATYSSSATIASLPGTYAIVPVLLDPNGRLGNYSVTTNFGTLTVLVTNLVPASAVAYVRSETELPWGVTVNENTLTAVFGPGWQDLRYETVDPNALFSSSNEFIFMIGSDDDALAMAGFLNANLPAMTNWVAAGGSLYLNAAPNEGGNIYFGFGVTLNDGDDTDTAGALHPSHPIFNGPFAPVGTTFTGDHFGHATVSGAGLTGLLTNASDGNFVLAEENYPAGHLLFGGMTTFNFQDPQPQASNLLANILVYASSFSQYQSPAPLTVSISSPGNGLSFATHQGITFSASAVALNGIQSMSLFVNSVLAASNTTTNISLLLTNLAPGAYSLEAMAADSNSLTAVATAYITVNAPGTALIDFDAVAAGAGPVAGAGLSNYLANYGVSVGGVSFATHVQAVNQSAYSGYALPVPSSAPNLLTQAGSSQPVSFTLNLAAPVQSVSFTRVAVGTNSGSASVSHPAWTAQLLDGAGNVEGASVSEPLLSSATNIPARRFTLAGTNIAAVRFNSDSQQTAAFPAVLLDDLLLDSNPTAATNPLSISLAAGGGPLVSPANVTLTATVGDGYGTHYYVAFYAGPSLIGTSATGALTWSNVPNGTYTVAAQVVDSNGYALLSGTVTVVVQPPANSTVINFDSLSAPASGSALASYLAGDGVGLGSSSAGSTVVVESQGQAPLAGLALASSAPNLLTQTGLNGGMSYTLGFSNWMTQLSFTRPGLIGTNPFVTHPAWQVTAYDALGHALASVQEPLTSSYTNVPAQIYTLAGEGIASLQVTSDGSALTTFPALLLDDLILTEGTSVVVTNPLAGQVFTSLGPIVLGAGVAARTGTVTNVNFYINGTLAGAAPASPFFFSWTAPSNGQYAVTAVAQNSSGVAAASAPVTITVASGFAILSPPQSQTLAQGASAALTVTTTGGSAVSYQWQLNNAPIAGATGAALTVSNAAAGVFSYSVMAASGGQSITSAPAVLTVLAPPALVPVAFTPLGVNITNIGIGQTVTMSESVPGPVSFQWRLNGTGMAGATNSFYTISNAQPLNSGNYQVVVANAVAFSVSPTFPVAVNIGSNALSTSNSSLAGAVVLNPNPLVGLPVGGNNSNSPVRDPLVSAIAGKRAGNLLWFSWTPTNSGNISLTTRGSSFDTLLGVYTTNAGAPATAADLAAVAQDDDSGGFFTSQVSFNALSNTTYEIAVGGFRGASGTVILGLPSASGYNLGQTAPAFSLQPQSQLVQPGATVSLSVMASNVVSYQWYFSGAPVPDGTNDTLVLSNFPASAVGNYWGVAQNAAGAAQSQTASIELATNGQSAPVSTNLTVDKFGDAADLASGVESRYRPEDLGGDTGGFTLSQSFSTLGATKEEGEPSHAGQAGGASYWYSYTAPASGTIQFDTAGSTFNTLLAIYTGPGDSFTTLTNAGAAYTTNYVQLGQPVVLVSNVTVRTRFFIAVDGYLGASGAAKLNVAFTQISNTVINTNLPTLILTNNKASVAIQYPPNGYATTHPLLTVRGVVKGLPGLQEPLASSVQMTVNASAAGPVTLGATHFAPILTSGPGGVEETVAQQSIAWTSNLTLVPGPNVITVQGLSIQGSNTENATYPVTHTVYLIQGSSTLTLRTSGSGRVTGLRNGATLEVGRNYTATAIPIGDNWVLTHWTSGTNIETLTNLSNEPKLTFTMFSNLVLQANFGPNPFPAVAGVYNGLFSPDGGVTETSSGFLTATLPASSRGTYSAKILLDGGAYPFNGAFTADGLAQQTVHRPGQPPLTVALQLDLTTTNDQLTGQISGSDGQTNWISPLQAYRTPFHTRTNAAKYTLILPPGANPTTPTPGGYGYATLSENASGHLTLTSHLADGATASQSLQAATNGAIPLYLSLYSRQGSLQGWLTLVSTNTNTPPLLGDNLTWIKAPGHPGAPDAAGFTNTPMAILSSLYTVPAPGQNALSLTNGTLTLSNSGWNTPLLYSNLAFAGDKLINHDPAAPPLSGTLNRNTGVLTLTFRPPGATTNATAKGVLLQNNPATNAAGWFPAGSFLLTQ